jgi:predicted nucleic acid-binding protein
VTGEAPPPPEHILCDTSFVSVRQVAVARPEFVEHWPSVVTDRLNRAVLAISVVSLAELRAGQIAAKFGPPRVERDKKIIDTYLHVPLDSQASETWGHLWAWAKTNGHAIGDNDLWIAATARSRNWPLACCDRDFIGLPDLEVIYLPRKPDSRT